MKAELVAEYLTALRLKNDLTFEAIAERSKRSVSTVKNLCTGKTEAKTAERIKKAQEQALAQKSKAGKKD